MANALLRICPKEEVNFHLPLQRRGELVREVLTVTKDSFQKSTAYCSSLFGIDVNDVTLISTDLDFIVKKTVLKEAHRQIRSLSVGH